MRELPTPVLRALLAVLQILRVADALQLRIAGELEARRLVAEREGIADDVSRYCAEVCAYPAPGGDA